MQKKKFCNHAGFTLIEILVWMAVVAVLGVLVAAILPTSLKRARDATRKHDIVQLSRGVEAYYSVAGEYPEVLPDCGQPLIYETTSLLARTPCQPDGTPYRYVVRAAGSEAWYSFYTNLEIKSDPVIAELLCTNGCGPDCAYNYGRPSSNRTLENCAIKYVCAPGGGRDGYCEAYDDPERSDCPDIYFDNPTCDSACSDPKNRCANASGKSVPDH